MSLRKQLSDILLTLLPPHSAEAIKGTDLIRLVRLQLAGNYSDASLRYHFSIMSCDPASPIAKVEKGQGYYRRGGKTGYASLLTQGRLDDLTDDSQDADPAVSRARKFRAVVTRYFEISGRFPFSFRHAFSAGDAFGHLWKFPELVLVDWETGGAPTEEMSLDESMLTLKQRLGLPPFSLHAARLRLEPRLESFREDFFQTLSVSMWAHGGELIYAAPVEDDALAQGLRKLSAVYGVGVVSLGLTRQALDDLPQPRSILTASPRECEAILGRLEIYRIAPAKPRPQLDWSTLNAMRSESEDAEKLVQWLTSCIDSKRVEMYRESTG